MADSNGLNITNLSLKRSNRVVLDSISLSLQKGETLLITGPSGSGKTSLALALTGLIPQQFSGSVTGTITIDNLSPFTHSVEQLTQRLVCVLSDSWNRFFQITVVEELQFGPQNLGFTPEHITQIVNNTAAAFDLLPLLNRRVDTLSGGQLQRVALAAAFTMEPDYLVLDEPSSCLDRQALNLLLKHLDTLRQHKQTGVILLEHRLTDFLDITDSVMVLNQGQAMFQGSTNDFRQNALDLAHSIGIRHPGFREPAPWQTLTEPVETGETTPILELKNISAGFDRTFLKDISIPIYPGITALTGPNGGGKSTLAHVLAGFLKPSKGRIEWSEPSIFRGLPDGRQVGLLQQDASSMLFCDTVAHEILEGPVNYHLSNLDVLLDKWLKITDLTEYSDQHPLHLSTGQFIRTAAAATMILEPRLLILDEPARGQDWAHLETILAHSTTQTGKNKLDCIIITHDYKLIHRFADHLMVMQEGQIVSSGKLKRTSK